MSEPPAQLSAPRLDYRERVLQTTSPRRGRSLLLGFAAILGGLLFLYSWEKNKKTETEPTVLEQIVQQAG